MTVNGDAGKPHPTQAIMLTGDVVILILDVSTAPTRFTRKTDQSAEHALHANRDEPMSATTPEVALLTPATHFDFSLHVPHDTQTNAMRFGDPRRRRQALACARATAEHVRVSFTDLRVSLASR